jgi:hypothetical protein
MDRGDSALSPYNILKCKNLISFLTNSYNQIIKSVDDKCMRNQIDQVLQLFLYYKTNVDYTLTQRIIFRGFSNYNGIL